MSSDSVPKEHRPRRRANWVLVSVTALTVLGFTYWMFTPSARVTPRRVYSLNNLHNFGIAIAGEHAVTGRFPVDGFNDLDGGPPYGWAVSLLPALDARAIHRSIDFGKPWDHADNEPATSIVLPCYQNPVVYRPARYSGGGERHRVDEHGFALLHYAGNLHVIGSGPPMSLDGISDGLAQTLLVGEINAGFAPWAAPGSIRDPGLGFGDDPKRFGSPEGRVHFLYADGAAREISADVDPSVLKALATPRGGETVAVP